MYCNKCGNELPDGASFCTSCGAPQSQIVEQSPNDPTPMPTQEVRPPEIYSAPAPEVSEPVKKPNKKGSPLKIVAIVLAVLILLSGVTVLGYFTFLPAKMTLKVAEYMSVVKHFNLFDKSMERYDNRVVKPVYEGTVDKSGEVAVSFDKSIFAQSGLSPETVDLISEYVKNISFTYGMSSDMKAKKQNVHIGLNYEKNPLVTLNLFLNNDKFGLASPELTNKTVTGSFKDLGKLNEIFPDIPKEALDAYSNMDPWIAAKVYDKVKINRQDIKKLMVDYTNQIIDSIDESDMSIERGQTTDVLGKDTGVQVVTIKLDQKAQKKILTGILTRMKDDQNLYNLTCGNLIKVFDILGENEMYSQLLQGVDMKKALSKTNYKQAIIALKGSIDETNFPELITAKIYIKGFDVVKATIKVPTGNADQDVLLTTENITNGQSYESVFSIASASGEEHVKMNLNLKKDYNQSDDTTNFKAEFVTDYSIGDNKSLVNFTLDSKEKAQGSSKVKQTLEMSLKVDSNNYGTQTNGELSLSLDGTRTRNAKGLETASDYTGTLKLTYPAQFADPVSLGFNVTSETAYGKKITVPDTSKGEVLDIATATQDDYNNLMNEIYEKLGALSMMMGSGQ
ncbi:MAG: zinc-ribbon domain-containing protein [Clostridia bacterium]|nr:zinc-ribbon domain-containing protein [Clostridia bacterium]